MKAAYSIMVVTFLVIGVINVASSENFALLFDGKSGHVSCGINNLPIGNEPRTEEAWIITTSPDGYQHVVGYGTAGVNNSAFALFTKGKDVVVTQWGASTAIPCDINDGKWHHLAVTHDGKSKQTIYVDGKNVGNWNQTLNTVIKTCIIGSCLNEAEQFFNGTIDEVRIWDVERTEKEIQDNMNKSLTGKEPNLVSSWSFNEGDGTTANDSTANKNHGTLINGVKWVNSDAPVESLSVYVIGKLIATWAKIKNN